MYGEYAENVFTHLNFCIEPTVFEGLKFAKDLIIANVALRLLIQSISLPYSVRHCLSLTIGSLLLFSNIGAAVLWTLGLTLGSYFVTLVFYFITKKYKGLLISLSVLSFLLICEIYIVNPKMWQQIRGIQMIASMKIISVAFDLDRDLYRPLNPIEFTGYVLCPATCILGPWISFQTYYRHLNVKFLLKGPWIKIILVNLFISMLYLVLSNCIIPLYIPDDMPKCLLAYRNAQAFRMSHYFISFMSIVSLVSSGIGLTGDCRSEIQVTKPYHIEIPRSLVQVVIYWNIPMHNWLRKYVYKPTQQYGRFSAILSTYVMSSLLHGVNLQLYAVLLSIGIFSYVEFYFRFKLSSSLSVCCHANPCPKRCQHKYNKHSRISIVLNSLFSLLTIIHLAYLGVMFEASFTIQETGYSYSHTLSKWAELYYFSHVFFLFMYLVCKIM